MNNGISQIFYEGSIDINALVRKQDELEKEIGQLRELYGALAQTHEKDIEKINDRIQDLEKELIDLRATINEMKDSVESVYRTVIVVEKNVSEINVKQDIAITAQDRFIGQLWKAFFALLGVITAAGAAIVTFAK